MSQNFLRGLKLYLEILNHFINIKNDLETEGNLKANNEVGGKDQSTKSKVNEDG